MHKIRALCPLIRTETLKKATAGRRRERLRQDLLRSYFLGLTLRDLDLYLKSKFREIMPLDGLSMGIL